MKLGIYCDILLYEISSTFLIILTCRNNLYWYQDPHNEDIHYPCLWYGSASDPNQKIEVLKLPMQAVVLYNTAVIPENEVSQPVKVVRKYIIPLDDSILLDFRGDGSVADFYLALMDFAEYDEELSNSYYWPDFISLMLLDNNILGDWLNKIISHSLFRSPIGLRKVFLYFLCAENCGIAEDLSSEMVLAGICPQSCLELLEDILKFDSAKGPYRRGSRVGQQYQAAVYDQHPNIEDLDNCNDSPVFIPNGEAEFIEEYLGRVHSLRLKYVSTNQLLEVPENVSEFLNQFRIWLPFNLTPDQHRSFGKKVYEWYNSLQKFIALQRQKSGCRTTIATVKYLLSKGNCFADQCEGSMLFTGIDLLGSDAAIVVLGDKEYNVPLAFCRLFDYPDDIALDVLNSSKGDMEIALLKIETCLQGKATPLISCESTSPYKYYHCYQHLSYAELSFLHRSVSRLVVYLFHNFTLVYSCPISYRSPDDMSKIWKKYHQYVSKQKSKKIVFEAGTVDMYFEQDDASSKVTERCEGTASPDETKKMFNVVDYLFLSNLYQLLFHEGTRFLVHVSYKRRSNHIARLAAGSSNQSDTAKVRDLNKPKRWPSSLPLMCHNLYWHVSQRAAYLCLGLDSGSLQSHREGHLSVTLITCGKYSQVSAIPARFLQPLDPDILTVYPNDRNLEFALAMMDFAEWELSTVSNTCSLKKWYNYPEFIHELIAKSSSWNAWRSAAERHSRGKNISRRLIYFEYLRETFLTIPGEMNLRSIDEDILCYPWDDHLSSDSEISADGSRSEALQKETLCIPPDEIASDCKFAIDFSEGKHIAKINDSNQKEHSLTDDLMLERKRVAELINQDGADTLNGNSSKYRKLTTMERYAVVPVEINSKTNFRYSALNLYWIDRSQLPCIFYDDLDRESAERFVVLPVSCSTYHYPVEVLRGAVIALNQPILRRCNDERTADFGLALMHFAELHLHSLQVGTGVEELNTENFNEEEVNEKLEFYSKMLEIDELTIQKLQKLPGMSQKESKKNYYYQWPEFIYHLINQPKWWGIWRKSVERKPNLERTARSQLYLRALFSDYDILMKAYK